MAEIQDIYTLIANACPRSKAVLVCSQLDLLDEHSQLSAELESESVGSPRSGDLAAEIAEVESKIAAATVEIKLQSVSASAWRATLAEHPPTPTDRTFGLSWNGVTFPVAVVAMCAAEPTLTAVDVQRLSEVLGQGEFYRLWSTVMELNLGSGDLGISVARAARFERSLEVTS